MYFAKRRETFLKVKKEEPLDEVEIKTDFEVKDWSTIQTRTNQTVQPLLTKVKSTCLLLKKFKNQEMPIGKMLMIFDTGEERLIAFTLPNVSCTVQELLDQVEIHEDSNVQCFENLGSKIDYIVTVGNFASRDVAILIKEAEDRVVAQHL